MATAAYFPAEYETEIAVDGQGVFIRQFTGETDDGGSKLFDSLAFFSLDRAKLFVDALQEAIAEYEYENSQGE